MNNTVFATLCDFSYYEKALKTLRSLRGCGGWSGAVVLLCVDFKPDDTPSDLSVEIVFLQHIDHTPLWKAWETHPIPGLPDERHIKKTVQWDKIQVFDSWCQRWNRVVFLDAGTSVLSSIEPLLELTWRGAFLAPRDGAPRDLSRVFRTQLALEANPPVTADLLQAFGEDILDKPYFLNCFFVFDTVFAPLAYVHMQDWMKRFPIMMCNEMGIMNLYFSMHLKVWMEMPTHRMDGTPLLGYCHTDFHGSPLREAFCLLKY
jgi:hypothetical protein